MTWSNFLHMPFSKKIQASAQRLREAQEKHQPCAPIRDRIGDKNIASAYAAQAINSALRQAAGAKIIGRKIGLTSFAVQKQLGVDQPDFGMLFDDMEIWNGTELEFSKLMQPKVEAEIAFVLEKDLAKERIGTTDVLSAVDYALASIEIVGSRVADWNIRITDTIADNASASHFVLGHRPMKLSDFDVANCAVQLQKNGTTVSEGTGANCMGSPINATVWLAQKMVEIGHPLRAGDVVLTGAVSAMVAVERGDFFEAVFEGLGKVGLQFV